jgi:PKD repeat protein
VTWRFPPARPQAILAETHYEANEGESIFFDGTGSQPTFIKGWIDLYESDGYTDSVITLDWDDQTLENWGKLHEIDGFDDEADSIRFYTPCPATLRLYTENYYEGDYIDTPCGLGAISSLDALDVGDDIESVLFNGVALNILTTWEWDFGAGYSEGSLGEVHTYGDNGDYTVLLRVTEQDGDADETGATVTVLNVPPTVMKGAMDQPNPQFILPLVHMLTFNATFSDPGWLDTHTALWSFGDGTNDAGTLVEENDEPDATGTVTASHAYAAPGDYTVTVTVTDDDGGAATSDAWTVHVADVEEAMDETADYIQNLPDSALKKHADQRKATFANMFCALDDMIAEEEWNGFTTSLEANIRSKADGQVDGKAGDDWVTDADAQQHICMKVDDITSYVETF